MSISRPEVGSGSGGVVPPLIAVQDADVCCPKDIETFPSLPTVIWVGNICQLLGHEKVIGRTNRTIKDDGIGRIFFRCS